ncbi:MAG: site-2 protease family protein, partial [Clostridia bacterium]|nr:site-2 protease family protein [Clostridia bacterium]
MLASLSDKIIELLFVIPCVLIALTVHEVAHGYMAFRLGDPTARNLGRLTLNPLKHLDPIGTICMIFFHFGWARPVPVNSRYFKKPRRDMALTSAAGPVSNFIMAFLG